jgi:hypothetical protein
MIFIGSAKGQPAVAGMTGGILSGAILLKKFLDTSPEFKKAFSMVMMTDVLQQMEKLKEVKKDVEDTIVS